MVKQGGRGAVPIKPAQTLQPPSVSRANSSPFHAALLNGRTLLGFIKGREVSRARGGCQHSPAFQTSAIQKHTGFEGSLEPKQDNPTCLWGDLHTGSDGKILLLHADHKHMALSPLALLPKKPVEESGVLRQP
ncbi:UNVERIFIED_CONTAM: hypothetical protein K2H54_074862 [Gekko kuhli]